MYYVYILYSKSLNKYYTGSTKDVETRLGEHLYNHKGFTSKAKDWVIVYTESFSLKKAALAREQQIKNKKSKKYIVWLMEKSKK